MTPLHSVMYLDMVRTRQDPVGICLHLHSVVLHALPSLGSQLQVDQLPSQSLSPALGLLCMLLLLLGILLSLLLTPNSPAWAQLKYFLRTALFILRTLCNQLLDTIQGSPKVLTQFGILIHLLLYMI